MKLLGTDIQYIHNTIGLPFDAGHRIFGGRGVPCTQPLSTATKTSSFHFVYEVGKSL
jgi:hypothetical protein